MDTRTKPGSRKGRRNYDVALKKRLAIAACEPGISVARLALDHGVNANMLHKWRREHLAGGAKQSHEAQLLPVRIAHSLRELTQHPVQAPSPHLEIPAPKTRAAKPGVIEIRCGAAIVRLEGAVDPATLAQVLRHLRP